MRSAIPFRVRHLLEAEASCRSCQDHGYLLRLYQRGDRSSPRQLSGLEPWRSRSVSLARLQHRGTRPGESPNPRFLRRGLRARPRAVEHLPAAGTKQQRPVAGRLCLFGRELAAQVDRPPGLDSRGASLQVVVAAGSGGLKRLGRRYFGGRRCSVQIASGKHCGAFAFEGSIANQCGSYIASRTKAVNPRPQGHDQQGRGAANKRHQARAGFQSCSMPDVTGPPRLITVIRPKLYVMHGVFLPP